MARERGRKNKKTQAWEQLGEFITEVGAKRVKDILTKCSQREFMMYYPLLLRYFKPQLQSVESVVTLEDNRLEVNRNILTKNIEVVPVIEVNHEPADTNLDQSN